ncbi:MAG TPA: outer membrane beta-barrel protein [Stellaceae bacterium]|jgi:hypothetical protein
MRRTETASAAVVALLLMSGAAAAQSVQPIPAFPGNALEPSAVGPEGTTVGNRERPDYDALGLRLGSFTIHPSLAAAGVYDSNIFATSGGAQSDFYADLTPSISINSDWNRHAVAASVSEESKLYASHTTENVNNVNANAGGRYDIENQVYLVGAGAYTLTHEDRSSPDAALGRNPTEYKQTVGYLGFVHEPGRLGFRVDGTLTSYDYNNAVNGVTGATIDQQFRDRIEYVIAPRISYEIIPGYRAFLRFVGNDRVYNAVDPNLNVKRNSHGWEVDAGTAVEITRLITGEIYGGYLEQDYDSPVWKSPQSFAFGGNLIWNITPLWSIKGSASQSVAETDIAPASSSTESNVAVVVEHELLRNVILTGNAGYIHDSYNGIIRTDDTFLIGAGAKYLLNRNLRLSANLTYSSRSSTSTATTNADFDRLIMMLGVQVEF